MTSAADTPDAAFPGATGLTMLEVYDWVAPDGLRGGSSHVHLASSEGYVVVSGEGRLQTLGADGYSETPLHPGDCLWFTPGIIHRLVNDGELRLAVVMQNAGLPEHGDAVLTFPPNILADPDAYVRAASLNADGERGDSLAEAARRRRDLAIEGYLVLRDQVVEEGPAALEPFYAAATALSAGHATDWRERWRTGAMATAALTGAHLDGIASGAAEHLASGGLWRIEHSAAPRAFGMCGRLTTYPIGQGVRTG
jgi:mannose-6-phosphate isomerase-like protein (cupin superfamily)